MSATVPIGVAAASLAAAAFEQAPVGLGVLDEIGRIGYANRVLCEWLGASLEEILGCDWRSIAPPESPQDGAWAPGREADGIWRDAMIRRLDGPSVAVRVAFRPIADGSQNVVVSVAARQAVGLEPPHAHEHYRRIIDNAGEGVLIVDSGRMPRFGNPRLETLFGYSLDEILRTRFESLIWDEDRAIVLQQFRRRMAGEKVAKTYELRAKHKSGEPIWVHISATRIDWDGAPAILAFVTDITIRHEAEETLRASVQQYRDLVNNTAEGIVIVLDDDRFGFVNPSFSRLLGVPAGDLVGRPIASIIHSDDLAAVRERRERFGRGESVPPKHAFRVHAGNGEVIWIEVSTVPIRWRGRAATLSFLTDVTERRRLQQELTVSLRERDTILENSIVGIVFVNDQGCVAWTNRAAQHMFDFESTSMVGCSIAEFYLSREEFVATRSEVNAAVAAGRTYEIEQRMRSRKGRVFWVLVSGKAVNLADQARGTVWSIIDISARKRLEAELRHASAEREAILQNTLVGITYLHGRRIQWVNRRLAEMVGQRPEAMIGESIKTLVADESSYYNLEAMANEVLAEQGHFRVEHPIQRADGSSLWVEVYGTLVEPTQPERGSIWTLLDIAERRQAQEDMRLALEKQRELSDLKSRFVSMSSHEFRTPLAAIQSSAELLRDYSERLPAGERTELLEIIASAVRRMSHLLEDVLTIGRADAGRMELAPTKIDLVALCGRIVEEARTVARDAAAPEIPIRLAFAGERGPTPLDENLLRHILGNLLSNALKYSRSDAGEVRFDVEQHRDRVVFTVTDQGIGIPQEDLPNLFETFYRAANVRNIAGTGLGLAIVKRAVDRHRGHIDVASELGRGSRFVVTIPIQ